MGQKVNPHGLRVGVIQGWDAKWIADKKDFAKYIKEDDTIRTTLKKKYFGAGISKIVVERAEGKVIVDIHTGRPGTLIGKAGAGAEEIKAIVSKIAKDKQVTVNIVEVKQPDMDAQLVAEAIAAQLEKRVSFRRAMRQCMGKATRSGAKGIKTMEIARCEQYHEGSIPLHTLRADIDYGFARALTTFGVIGVKVWIYRGEILPKKKKTVKKEVTE